ncbi:MAG: GNAT family N-acetyltransferase [Myxococcaceae bacterium]
MPSSRRLKILEGIQAAPKDQWNALLGPDPVPFLRWEWLNALEESESACEETGWAPHHLTLWEGDTLIGAAPAYRKFHSMGEYVYDFSWAQAAQQMGIPYYPKLLVGVPLSPITAPRFLARDSKRLPEIRKELLAAAIDSGQETGCSSVHVIFPPEQEALTLESYGLSRRTGMQYHWRNPGYRTYEDYLSRFSSKRRNQLRRERAAAEAQGITLRTIRGATLDERHSRLAFKLYESTCEKNAWGRVQLNQGFFDRTFQSLPEFVEIVEAVRGNKVLAGAFNLSTSTRLFGRYWGCFEDHPFLHFNVCLYHSVDDCIQRGLKAFEPGAGGEHKISRGFEPTAIHSVHKIFDDRLDRAVENFVHRERAQLQPIIDTSAEISGMKPWPG